MIDPMTLGSDFLRICVGAFLLPHGIPKLLNLRDEAQKLEEELDLKPGILWAGVMVFVQVASAVMIILNIAALLNIALVIVLHLAAISLKNKKNGWYWHKKGIEYNAFWICAAVASGLQIYATEGLSF